MPTDPQLDRIRSDFIEKTGLISQAEGLPRIAGRIFGMLIFDGTPTAFGALATGLQVSRASISSSIRLLEDRGLVKRLTKPGERQDYFQLAPNPYQSMLQGLQTRTQAVKQDIAHTLSELPGDAPAARRIADYAQFLEAKSTAVETALATLSAAQAPNQEDPQNDR